jgi:hypothetical protein
MSPAVYSLFFAARNILRSRHERFEFICMTTADDLKVWQQFDDEDDDDVAAFDGNVTWIWTVANVLEETFASIFREEDIFW